METIIRDKTVEYQQKNAITKEFKHGLKKLMIMLDKPIDSSNTGAANGVNVAFQK